DSVRPAAAAKAIRLRTAIDPDVGPATGDADRLQQVVWNLLANAVKFTPAGGNVELRLERAGAAARLSVSDSGAGIEPQFLPHLFERFTQADGSTRRAHAGLGLGLAIVRHLVELHGGSVAARSDGKGQGAAFVVELPLAQAAVQREEATTATAIAHAMSGRPADARVLDGIRVLVVDDEADMRDLICE